MSKNKNYFLKEGGDKYYDRNKTKIIKFQNEPLSNKIIDQINIIKSRKINILEVGCGSAERLIYLKKIFPKVSFYGIDPSSKSIKGKNKKNINLKRSTADKLPFRNSFFDIIIYGFCLYLIDNKDLIKVVSEADRVTKNKSIIIIFDFYSKVLKYKKFKHKKNIFIRKMDNSKIFLWLPHYKLQSLKTSLYPGKKNDFLSLICIKKNLKI